MAPQTRREFAQSCAAAVALGTSGTSSFASDETSKPYDKGFRFVSGAPTKGTLELARRYPIAASCITAEVVKN